MRFNTLWTWVNLINKKHPLYNIKKTHEHFGQPPLVLKSDSSSLSIQVHITASSRFILLMEEILHHLGCMKPYK